MSEPPISRGFRGRRGSAGVDARLPPGQHLVTDFPVLSAGPTPEPDLATWRFTLEDGDSPIGEWSWAEFNALPQTELTVDIHCVTTWSKFDTHWRGVSIDTLLEAAGLSEPPAAFVLAHSEGGYTTNLPSEDLVDGKAMVATHSTASRSIRSMAGRRGCWCRISISGRAPNGCGSCNSSTRTSAVSGKSLAITAMAIPGASSAMTAISA